MLIQGTTLPTLAKWLRLDNKEEEFTASPLDEFLEEPTNALLEEVVIKPHHGVAGKKIVDLKFPHNALIAIIKRQDQYLTPNGTTKLELDDKLFILSGSKEGIRDVMSCFNDQAEACGRAIESESGQ